MKWNQLASIYGQLFVQLPRFTELTFFIVVVVVGTRNNGCQGDQPCLVNAPIEHNNKMERQLASENPCQFYSISFHFVASFLLPLSRYASSARIRAAFLGAWCLPPFAL